MEKQIQVGKGNEVREILHEKVQAYNRSYFEKAGFENLSVTVEEAGEIVAGTAGIIRGDWLLIQELWVKESMRGNGIGSEVLATAEQTAKEKGCSHVLLDTFEFQAPGFYKKKGYQEVFVYEEHPITGKHYYLAKNLERGLDSDVGEDLTV